METILEGPLPTEVSGKGQMSMLHVTGAGGLQLPPRHLPGAGPAVWELLGAGLAVLPCSRKDAPSFLALNPGENMGLQVLYVLCLS